MFKRLCYKMKFKIVLIFLLITLSASFIKCTSSYSKDQMKCFALEKVWFNNQCEKLKSQTPCGPGEWLVLMNPEDKNDLLKLQPECQLKKCTKKDEFWWVSENRCVTKLEAMRNYCKGKDVLVDHDYYGDGYCTCYDDAGSFEDSNDCYEFYQKGRCKITEVVTYNKTSGFATCTEDLCFELNHPNLKKKGSVKKQLKPRSKVSEKKYYAPLEGNSQCYKIGPQAMCHHLGESAQFNIHKIVKIPRCVLSTSNALNTIDAVPGCKLDESTNECREEVKVQGNTEEELVAHLLNEAKRKAKIG